MSVSELPFEKAELDEGVISSNRKKSRLRDDPPKKRHPPKQPHRFLLRLYFSSGHKNHSLICKHIFIFNANIKHNQLHYTYIHHSHGIIIKAPFCLHVMELQEASLHLIFNWMVSSQSHISSDEVKSHRSSLQPIGSSQKRWWQA